MILLFSRRFSPYSCFKSGLRASHNSCNECMLRSASDNGVLNNPGSMMLTCTPQGRISRLRASENASTPYLVIL